MRAASSEPITPVDLVRTNTITTFNAPEEAWNSGVRAAVVASSGSIYGTAWSPEEFGYASVPVDEDTDLRYVDPYALTKDFGERMGAVYARQGMQVTALRFHWILTPDEVRSFIAEQPVEGNTRNLWGYVDLGEAARACVLSLRQRAESERFHALMIAAEDTGTEQPTADLRRARSGDRGDHAAARHHGAFDCRRAAGVIGWTHRSRWRATEPGGGR